MKPTNTNSTEEIIAIEKAALDRWGKGDPRAVLHTYAPDITYFDPYQEKRLAGLEAMKKLYAPMAGKVKIERFEMLDPKVQQHGDVAVLTYNLVEDLQKSADTPETLHLAWNSTQVYARIEGTWKILHAHWSLTKPELQTH
jgi:ketosteroid isomerase-like protein